MKIPPPIGQFAEALAFLTRYPLPGLLFIAEPAGARAAWAFPLAGAIAAAVPALILAGLMMAGATPLLAVLVALAVYVLITGGLHQDGLADAADGLFGARTKERALEIMKDSRIGSHGALALIFVTAIKAASLADIAATGGAPLMFVAAAAAGRAVMVAHWHLLPPARPDGAAASLGRPGIRPMAVAILTALVIVAGLAGAAGLIGPALGASLCAAAIAAAFTWFARRKIEGHTGDTLGATAELGETAFLAALAILI